MKTLIPKLIAPVAIAIALLAQSRLALAYESRFEILPSLDTPEKLADLARRRVTVISSNRNGDTYTADASAVLRVDVARLFAAAQDYDRYVEFGMPHLYASKVMDRPAPDLLYSYSGMKFSSMNSTQYMEVRVHRSLNERGAMGMAKGMAMGLEWELTARRPEWPATQPRFSKMDGSFYIEPLADGTVYVRYFIKNGVNVPLGGALSGVVQRALRKGAGDVIMALARQAPKRH